MQKIKAKDIDEAVKELGEAMIEALKLDGQENDIILKRKANHKRLQIAKELVRALQVSY